MNKKHHQLITVDDYESLIGSQTIDRLHRKAAPMRDMHIVNVNSTFYGGGVAELLSSLTLLMNSVGIKTGWRAIQGSPDYFSVTKKMHNALQGGNINLSGRKKRLYEDVIFQNAVRNHLDHDLVVIHDPQPLPMIMHYNKRGPWIWRCHLDMSAPHDETWQYLLPFIERYDALIFSIKEYQRQTRSPQRYFMPAINPFSIKNKDMSQAEIDERLDHYKIPTDLPLVVQISRFDRFKDPEGVIKAFKIARKEVDATLVLLGDIATDDPEGDKVYESLLGSREERILILSHEDTALVNALQRRADVVLQKSLREGFGLTVTEAMWKGTPVIGGDVGGIRYQIEDGVNGFLVSSVEQAASRIVQLLQDEKLRQQIGKKAHETVRQKFLLTRLLEQYIDLFSDFETIYKLKNGS